MVFGYFDKKLKWKLMKDMIVRKAVLSLAAVVLLCSSATAADTVTKTTNKKAAAPKTTKPQFKNETEKREAILKAFLSEATSEQIDAIIKTFKIPAKGTLTEKKKALTKYLGLLKDVKDLRKVFEVVVKDVFVSPDLKKKFFISADAGVHIRSKKDPASGLLTLYGDQGSLYIKFQKQVVSARLIRIDLSRKEVFGEGNAMMREGDRVIVGDKFYFNSETKHGIIYNAKTYIKPYFYYGKSIKKIGDRNYVLQKGWFTTCDDKNPHYKFSVSKCWMYQDVRLLAYDVTYNVSDFPVFWFPFIFHPMEGTGLWTGLGRDTRVGWFLQLVNLGPFLGLPFNMNLDFYQRLGTAILLKPDGKHKISLKNFKLDWYFGIALDKPLGQDVYGVWQNTVGGDNDQNNDTGTYGDWKRELRWAIDLKQSVTIPYDTSNPKAGNLSLNVNFNLMSDPFFKTDFDRTHIKVIQLEKIFRQEEVSFFSQGSAAPRNWDFSITDTRGGSTLNLSGKWAFYAKENLNRKNRYANDFYIYKKDTITLPNIDYKFRGTFFSSAPLPTINTNTNTSATNTLTSTTNTKAVKLDILDTSDDPAGAKAKQKITYSLGYSAGLNFLVEKKYSTVDDSLDEKKYRRVLSLGIPGSFKIDNLLDTSLNLGLSDTDQWGETTTTNQVQANQKASITTFNENATVGLGHAFNKGLLSEVGGRISASHTMSVRVSDAPAVNDNLNAIRSHGMSFNASLNFFKTTIRASTSYDMVVYKEETRGWGRERFGDLAINFSSNPFSFFKINDSYSYVIKTGKPSDNRMTLTFTAPSFRLPTSDKASSFTATIGWSHYYNDHRANKLSINLSLNLEISKLWAVTLSMSTLNKELYLYSDDYAGFYGKESRSILKDFVYSFMIWDMDKLKESRFNLQSLNMSLKHDLHEWLLSFTASMKQLKNTNNGRQFSYFDFSFVFSISMKNNIGINFPDHRYHYYAEPDGKYTGKYN